MKVVNLTEENEKLQTELASKDINFANRVEELTEKISKVKHSEDFLKN